MIALKRDKKRLYGYHILFWLGYAVYFYGVNKLGDLTYPWQKVLIYVPGFSLVFYSVYGILWANFSERFTWRGLRYLAGFYVGFSLLAFGVAFVFLEGTAFDLMAGASPSFLGFMQTLAVLLSNFSVFALAYFWMRRSIANARAKQLAAEEKAAAMERLLDAERQKQRFEYLSLSAQVSPHFLANLVNTWMGQLGNTHGELAQSMDRMHTLVVYHMEAKEQAKAVVPLPRELEALRSYVQLSQRPDRPVYATLDVPHQVAGYTIPPTVLITLLENGLKHGVSDDPAHPIRMRLVMDGHVMRFSCRNRTKERAAWQSHGVGLVNLRRRLAIKYGDRATLATDTRGKEFVAELTIVY